MRGTAARGAEDRIVRTARDGRVAATQRDPLTAGAGVDDGVGGTAGNALPRDAADRLVAGAAAGDRVGCGAPDRLVAASAAEHRLMAAGCVDKDIGAATAEGRLARHAGDRLVAAAAAAHRIGRSAPDHFVAGSAAGDRLMAEMAVEKLVRAAAAEDRVADRAADRFRAVAEKDRITGAVIHRAVIAVQQADGAAIGGNQSNALIPGGGCDAAGAGAVVE